MVPETAGRRLLRQYPGLPVSLSGIALLGYDVQFVLGKPGLQGIDVVVAVFLAALAAAIVYGGYQIGERGRTPLQGLWIFAAMHLFGLTGFLVAALLISYQFLHGVPVVDVFLLAISAGATTATLGIWLVLYYTELQEKASELYAHRERVSNLNKRLTILQRVLRHNLRNEMGIIQGHTETMLENTDSDDRQHSLEVILEHTENLESLSDEAHRLRQIWNEDGTVEVDAVEVVRAAVADVENDHPAADVATDLPESAPVVVHPQFSVAVREALTNSVTHNDPATVDVEVVVERRDDGDVEVRVSDTGSGTPAFEWETLQQAEELPLKHGTGLGMWLIYWLVEKSGGELQYESNVPHGTVVRMRLRGAGGTVEGEGAPSTAEFGPPPRRGS